MAPLTESRFARDIFQAGPGLLTPDETSDRNSQNATSRSSNDGINKASKPATGKSGYDENPKKRSKSDQKGGSAGLRFFVVDHPDQLKDKKQMRQNRQHVMHTYLDKEAKKPNSTDSRVRRQVMEQAKASQERRTAEFTAAGSRQDLSRLTPPDSLPSNGSLYDGSDSENVNSDAYDSTHSTKSLRHPSKRHSTAPTSSTFDGPPLVSGIGGRYDNSAFMHAVASDIPWPLTRYNMGGEINAFNTWPSLEDPSLDIKELKFSCSQRFGSSGLTVLWLPAMLKARHAFLSTLCISSAHDDIMRRNLLPPEQRGTESLMKRLRVRQGVISMINESLSDPELRAADETIIAVLHVLHSEIMGCNDQSMQIHQIGLHEMVRERGGLSKLGLQGQLAMCLAISMFLLAALRETLPHSDYMDFATEQNTRIPEDVSKLPESPIYCRPTGFQNVNQMITESSETFKLLDHVRILTRALNLGNMGNTVNRTIADLCEAIFAATPGWELDVRDMNERYRYESIRLASVLFAHAVSRRVSLSKAAAELSDPSTRPASVILSDKTTPLPILLKNALMRTDTSSLWDHLIGVLFWVTLIAGAAANPGPIANEDRESDDEDARKWLAAIVVRCCIVLCFEFAAPVLETLKRSIAIQSLLVTARERKDDESQGNTQRTWTEVDIRSNKSKSVEKQSSQRGFADFAQDFLSI